MNNELFVALWSALTLGTILYLALIAQIWSNMTFQDNVKFIAGCLSAGRSKVVVLDAKIDLYQRLDDHLYQQIQSVNENMQWAVETIADALGANEEELAGDDE